MNTRRVITTSTLTLFLLLSGCGAVITFVAQFACPDYSDERHAGDKYTDYKITSLQFTKAGYQIDTSGHQVDFQLVDDLIADWELCTGRKAATCAFNIKVADDSGVSPGGQEGFPCHIPKFEGKGCLENRSCGCAGIVQYPNIVVVTPNMAALKHEMLHLILRIDDHSDEWFARCE